MGTKICLASLSDHQLLESGDDAVRREHRFPIRILDFLNEMERRSLHLTEGHSSLFDYCTRRWRFSSSKAGRYIAAARCMKKYTEIRPLLEGRGVTVCGAARIAGILSEDNCEELLHRVAGRRFAEIESIVAEHSIAPNVRDSVRVIGKEGKPIDRKSAGQDIFDAGANAASSSPGTPENHSQRGSDFQSERKPEAVESPVSPAVSGKPKPARRYEIRFSASEEFLMKLERAKAICSTRSSLEAILEKALDELLERRDPEGKQARRVARNSRQKRRGDERRKAAQGGGRQSRPNGGSVTEQPRGKEPRPGPAHTRHIPANIRDEVFARDGGRCTFVGRSGTRCGSTHHLQINHIHPFALGGNHAPENLGLLCGKHNRLEAERIFGDHGSVTRQPATGAAIARE